MNRLKPSGSSSLPPKESCASRGPCGTTSTALRLLADELFDEPVVVQHGFDVVRPAVEVDDEINLARLAEALGDENGYACCRSSAPWPRRACRCSGGRRHAWRGETGRWAIGRESTRPGRRSAAGRSSPRAAKAAQQIKVKAESFMRWTPRLYRSSHPRGRLGDNEVAELRASRQMAAHAGRVPKVLSQTRVFAFRSNRARETDIRAKPFGTRFADSQAAICRRTAGSTGVSVASPSCTHTLSQLSRRPCRSWRLPVLGKPLEGLRPPSRFQGVGGTHCRYR